MKNTELAVKQIVNLRRGKGQARTDKGWPLRRKALKLKTLPRPRAYIKVGFHLPTTHQKFNFTQLMA